VVHGGYVFSAIICWISEAQNNKAVERLGVMKKYNMLIFIAFLSLSCASDPAFTPHDSYEELHSATVLDAPRPAAGNFAPENRFRVERGRYLVELLGCGACHTDGALEGAPKIKKALAGSRIGIAYMNPFGDDRPGVVYPPNITPDIRTGIGGWSDEQIAIAIRAGQGRHLSRRIAVMPWQGYTKMTDDDVDAIVAYLRSIKPVEHEVPDEVAPGTRAKEPYVYFGTYRSR
jgi:mono/diheme cytochrome c family protein